MVATTRIRKINNKIFQGTGEITPVRAEQSATYDNNEEYLGAGRAIDKDTSTTSIAVAGSDDTIWIKLHFDQVHCIPRITTQIWSFQHFWTCTKDDCSDCVGRYCDDLLLTISTEGTTTSNLPDYTNCRYGDTVKLEMSSESHSQLTVYEIVVIGKQGNAQC